jgi:hypothetical protein
MGVVHGEGHGERTGHVRVALVDCTGVLGEIIRNVVTDAPGVRVVAEMSADRLDHATGADDVDVVLWNNADEQRVRRLLTDSAGVPPVLTAVDDGRSAVLWRVVPDRLPLGVLSPGSLVDWIRAAAAR